MEDAPVKTSAPDRTRPRSGAAIVRVPRMQAKLHRWAVADPGHRFDDLFNLVHDPATLLAAFDRVASNAGAHTPGSDGVTVAKVRDRVGVPVFLQDLRQQLKAGTFRPQPVRERKIPKPGGSGKLRKLGIPTVADRVVQAALKLVLEPIFEADFVPVSYGFRPMRRAHDAIAEIHYFGSRGYQWVVDADIEACFDSIDHTALLGRVRRRVKDKRVVGLVKAFLKAGILTELGHSRTATPARRKAGSCPRCWPTSPCPCSTSTCRAMDVADGDRGPSLAAPPEGPGDLAAGPLRGRFRRHGQRHRDHAQRCARKSRQCSPRSGSAFESKTRIAHLSEGLDFLGFHIQWRRKRGTRISGTSTPLSLTGPSGSSRTRSVP